MNNKGDFNQGHGVISNNELIPDGYCICPNCGHRESHQRNVPCYNRKCPKCGAPMTSV